MSYQIDVIHVANVSQFSGLTISTSGAVAASVSGQTVATTISGQSVTTVPTGLTLRAPSFQIITDLSGGAALTSVASMKGLTLAPISGSVNAAIHIGSSTTPPYISGGYVLDIGERQEFEIQNANMLRVFARLSGVAVSVFGVN